MNRRRFLKSLLVPAALSAASKDARAQTRRRPARHAAPGAGKIERVGVSSRSFQDFFESTHDPAAPAPPGRLALLDFPQMIADRYKVHNLELAAPHFASLEPAYLLELKANLVRAHSRLINIPVHIPELEAGAGLSDSTVAVRDAAIAASKKWIDIARQLGARSVRCDPGTVDPDNVAATVDSYRQLAAYGRAKGVAVLIENHDAIGSARPETLVILVRGVASPFMGTLPDFGSFPDDSARERGLNMLFPYARTTCHARGQSLDAGGNETAFNFQACVQIAQRSAFKGMYSIEYEGSGDAYQGVQGVVNELLRFL
jgi:hypothetical protein